MVWEGNSPHQSLSRNSPQCLFLNPSMFALETLVFDRDHYFEWLKLTTGGSSAPMSRNEWQPMTFRSSLVHTSVEKVSSFFGKICTFCSVRRTKPNANRQPDAAGFLLLRGKIWPEKWNNKQFHSAGNVWSLFLYMDMDAAMSIYYVRLTLISCSKLFLRCHKANKDIVKSCLRVCSDSHLPIGRCTLTQITTRGWRTAWFEASRSFSVDLSADRSKEFTWISKPIHRLSNDIMKDSKYIWIN